MVTRWDDRGAGGASSRPRGAFAVGSRVVHGLGGLRRQAGVGVGICCGRGIPSWGSRGSLMMADGRVQARRPISPRGRRPRIIRADGGKRRRVETQRRL